VPNGFEKALWRAAAHTGDSDSTAAITGNLIGAMVGVSGLPSAWLAELELKEVIERMTTDLHRSMILGLELDHDAYPPL
jgi:ADP-ribosylglycohydrolase